MSLAECRIKGSRVQSQLDFGEVLATDSLVGRRKHPVRCFQHSVNRSEQLQSLGELAVAQSDAGHTREAGSDVGGGP